MKYFIPFFVFLYACKRRTTNYSRLVFLFCWNAVQAMISAISSKTIFYEQHPCRKTYTTNFHWKRNYNSVKNNTSFYRDWYSNCDFFCRSIFPYLSSVSPIIRLCIFTRTLSHEWRRVIIANRLPFLLIAYSLERSNDDVNHHHDHDGCMPVWSCG